MQRLRGAGYYVGFAILVAHVTELILASYPARLSSPSWRITFVGGTANTVFLSMLVMFLLTAIAVIAADRRVTYVITALSAMAGIILLGMSGMFALDALQMRNQVRQSLAERYDYTAGWVLVRMLIASLGFLILTVATFRTARSLRPDTSRVSNKGSNLIVGGVGSPRSEKPVPTLSAEKPVAAQVSDGEQ
jgi:hypothetical protein